MAMGQNPAPEHGLASGTLQYLALQAGRLAQELGSTSLVLRSGDSCLVMCCAAGRIVKV